MLSVCTAKLVDGRCWDTLLKTLPRCCAVSIKWRLLFSVPGKSLSLFWRANRLWSTADSDSRPGGCRTNMPQFRQSTPDYGLGLHVKVNETLQIVPSSLDSGTQGWGLRVCTQCSGFWGSGLGFRMQGSGLRFSHWKPSRFSLFARKRLLLYEKAFKSKICGDEVY